tara:strand:+ start:1111 stop:1467 length:357 start_codon:yes stop_codon:yes gene_type:complete
MGRLTTHILDTANGCPAAGVVIQLKTRDGDGKFKVISTLVTGEDGRCGSPIIEGEDFREGEYQLEFCVGDYFASKKEKIAQTAFLQIVPVRFFVGSANEHYHVPLLISPFGYSTYRGS